ncbi:MAG: DNA repair protein RecN [Tenericutes bacterium HGW-Tenericutes-5]|jgi:DNA repair protein RecN (Recombination protein N)|nr:MAG: DNA repair protein RecN [Tenericutes bacterium HGW-Tenericutes-5]
MLKSLEVKNFAIIDNIKLDFFQGMTVLTGETGAGKSIIVDAISLLLGDRALKEMISSKSETAEITGVFSIASGDISRILEENNLDYEDDLTVYRMIAKDKSNVVKINNQNSSLKVLKDLAVYLADIHSQFDTSQLINPENYLSLIDNFKRVRILPLVTKYQESLNLYKERVKDYHATIKSRDESIRKLDLYKFQLNELNNLALEKDEYIRITEEVNILSNIDKINTILEKAKFYLSEEQVLDKIYEIKADFDSISKYSEEFFGVSERLNNLYYELDDIYSIINDKTDSLDFTKSDFEILQERINDLDKIQKKYDKNIEELIDYCDFLKTEIDMVENFDEIVKEKHSSVKDAFKQAFQDAISLHEFREDIALRITKDIESTLEELVIKNAQFKIVLNLAEVKDEFDISAFKLGGLDEVEFMISTNKGEPLKPLARTASGGEMSRVMLAFKTIFARSQKIPTIIFDEIDTGISGFIAKQIARKIQELSKVTQVISITHIPQVVAQGEHHLSISKKLVNNQTSISVKYLKYEERVDEIAKMVSGDKITETAKDIAKELLLNP